MNGEQLLEWELVGETEVILETRYLLRHLESEDRGFIFFWKVGKFLRD
jgi:hypothetical protein